MPATVEICVQGIESALAAEKGGADRIELCEDLGVGGVTPSAGAIAVCCRRLSIPVHVLIRPRGGDFLYCDAEFQAMTHDIKTARSLGAAGVVFGTLDAEAHVDRRRTALLIEMARPMSITFHKAFDEVPDPFAVLEALIDLGAERVLTSGQARSASEGLDRLVALNRKAAGRIIVMPGGRITETDLPVLIERGLREIHVGSAACSEGKTDARRVARIVALARSPGLENRSMS